MATLRKEYRKLVDDIRQLIPYDANSAERKCLNLINYVRTNFARFNKEGVANIQRQLILDSLRELLKETKIAVVHQAFPQQTLAPVVKPPSKPKISNPQQSSNVVVSIKPKKRF